MGILVGETTMHGDKRTNELLDQPDAILAYLKKLARDELNLHPEQVEQIELGSSVLESLNLDSLAQVVLITQIEEKYGLTFEIEDRERLQAVQTVKDLVELIRNVSRRGSSPCS